MAGAKAALTKDCSDGGLRKLVLRYNSFRSTRQQHLLHLQINRNIGAAEAVDGLLGVADKKELAGNR